MARRASSSLEKQLQLIGSIAATWNDLDDSTNYVLERCLAVPPELFMHVATRINGYDGKKEIIKIWATANMEPVARDAIIDTLSAARTAKTYRDAIIHTIPDEFEPDRGKTVKTQARVQRIDISQKALGSVARFAKVVNAEMLEFVDYTTSMMIEARPRRTKLRARDPQSYAEERRELLAQALHLQGKRKALPPLPPLPKGLLAPQDFLEN